MGFMLRMRASGPSGGGVRGSGPSGRGGGGGFEGFEAQSSARLLLTEREGAKSVVNLSFFGHFDSSADNSPAQPPCFAAHEQKRTIDDTSSRSWIRPLPPEENCGRELKEWTRFEGATNCGAGKARLRHRRGAEGFPCASE